MSVPTAAQPIVDPISVSPLSARSAALVGAGTLILNAATFLIYLGVARLVTRAEYGEIFALLSAVFIGYVPAVVASITVARRIAIVSASDGPAATARIERSALRLTYAVALILLVLGEFLRTWIVAALHVVDATAVSWATVALAFSLVYQVQRGVLQGLERYRALAISYMIEGVGRLVLALVGTAWMGESGFFAGVSAALAILIAYSSVELIRHRAVAGSNGEPSTNGGNVGSSATAVAIGVVTVLSMYDAVLAKRWFMPDSAGFYAAAAVVGRATYSTVAFIPAILLPRLVHLNAKGRSTTRVLVLGFVATATPMLGVTAAVALLPNLVIAVVAGSSFDAAAPYALPLSLAAGSLALANLATTYVIARGYFGVVPWLVTAGVAEITVVSVWHATLGQVAWTICAGHGVILLIAGAALLVAGNDQA